MFGRARSQGKATKTKWRIRSLSVLSLALLAVIIFRLWQMQIANHGYYSARASSQQDVSRELGAERGGIFAEEHDGLGGWRPVPLAINRSASLVFADTRQITNVKTIAPIVATALQMSTDDITKLLSKPNDAYVPLAHRVPDDIVQSLKDKNIAGIYFTPEEQRFYPNDNIGSHVIGFVNYRDIGMAGQYGVEGYFDKILAGRAGQVTAEQGAGGDVIAVGNRQLTPAKDGANINLTIDWTVEFKACQALDDWIKQHGATGGSVVVMDPSTGAIIAMCGTPDFDPNVYNETTQLNVFNNPAIFNQYEPGSIFKAISMASALDRGKITPNSTYVDTGEVKIGPNTIRNADKKAHGLQTMTYVLDQSLNTGAIYAMRQVGGDVFRSYVQAFGFGAATGVDLSGEASGDINSLSKKGEIYSATASFGQGISVTPLQIAAAFGAIANGGKLLQPHIVNTIDYPDGHTDQMQTKTVRQVISEQTAALLRGMLVDVVEHGEGKHAAVPGYYVAGKTGTAQIPRADGKGYEVGPTIGTFAGFAPVDDPKFVMVVRVDRPKDVQFAESSAAPLFGDIAKFILQYDEVPPARPIK